MEDCIFCKIVAGEVPSDIVYQDDEIIAFPDISPLAPVHLLIIPRRHIALLSELTDSDKDLAGKMSLVANQLAREQGISETGYRVVINCGENAGMGVAHLHMHLLGGRRLSNSLG